MNVAATKSTSKKPAGELTRLRLVRFRAFEDFTISFKEGAYLVGPNNAGKSTVLTAIRLADVLIRLAHRRNPQFSVDDAGMRAVGYPVQLREFPALRDSVRHEFGGAESRLELTLSSGARLVAVWPAEDGDDYGDRDAFYYLVQPSGAIVRNTQQARAHFPLIGVVPVLSPVDHSERLLDDAYVRQNVSGRLSSRHFRNQLRLLQEDGDLDAFLDWAEPWMGDLRLDRLKTEFTDDGPVVVAFTYEGASRVPKELVWAGDGIQVWLQLLFQIYRVRERDVIVLDEPEVYLHPDLQRRLVRLLESTGAQIVMATHSSEVLAEANSRQTVLIDRTRRSALRPHTEAQHESLSEMLGTAFNLRLARTLRSKVAVFVEGHDMAVLRQVARRLSLDHLAQENGLTVVPLNGYTSWGHVQPFKWLTQELLPNAMKTYVILDRDYRSDTERDRVMTELEEIEVTCHVWERKELESYLLSAEAMSRISTCPVETIEQWLNEITWNMGTDVFSRQLQERLKESTDASHHAVSVTTAFKVEFDEHWTDPGHRLRFSPPKRVISAVNQRLQDQGFKAVSIPGIARSLRVGEVPAEMADALRRIETAVALSGS